VSALWRDPAEWTRKPILNTARMCKFSKLGFGSEKSVGADSRASNYSQW
jgi:hypothetical protein